MVLSILFGWIFAPLILVLNQITTYTATHLQTEQVRYYYFLPKEAGKAIALTIDDAPSEDTPLLLELLRQYQIKATFFVIGEHARKYPQILEQIRSEGHLIAHHDLIDRRSVSVDPEQFEKDFLLVEQEISPKKYFRPGCGFYSKRLLDQLQKHGYTTILGNVYPFDPHIPSATFLEEYIKGTIRPGSIIILHDGVGWNWLRRICWVGWLSDGRLRRTTRALSGVIPKLLQEGYTFKTLEEMDALEKLKKD